VICPGCPACEAGEWPQLETDDEEDAFSLRHLPFQFKGYSGTIPERWRRYFLRRPIYWIGRELQK
jgi:hypothetical protein